MLLEHRPGFRNYLSILEFLFPGLAKLKGILKVVHLETVRGQGVKWLLHEHLLSTIMFGPGKASAALPDSAWALQPHTLPESADPDERCRRGEHPLLRGSIVDATGASASPTGLSLKP